jgi:hypothetical protein
MKKDKKLTNTKTSEKYVKIDEKQFCRLFDSRFDAKFDARFDACFDACFDAKFDARFEVKFNELFGPALERELPKAAGVLLEYFDDKFNVMYEYLQMNIDRLDRQHEEFENKFARDEKWLHNHEFRISKLEGQN